MGPQRPCRGGIRQPRRGLAGSPWAGTITSSPAAISTNHYAILGLLVVFAHGRNGAVWSTSRLSAEWAGWQSRGGSVLPGTAPAAVYDFSVCLTAVGTNRALWLDVTTDGAKCRWQPPGEADHQ